MEVHQAHATALLGLRKESAEQLTGEVQGYAALLPGNRPALKPEDEPQKWVQCAKCSLWRKVPFLPWASTSLSRVLAGSDYPSELMTLQPVMLSATDWHPMNVCVAEARSGATMQAGRWWDLPR
jgi:hypothetical protein